MENAQQEPSMEEILASIRRIISEDETDDAAATPATGPVAVPDAPEPAEETAHAGDATETTDADATNSEPDNAKPELKTEDIAMIKMNAAAATQDTVEDAMLDKTAEEAASTAFQTLSQSVRVSEGEGKTLEDIVTEMLRPMVKAWLDEHLPAIVEEKVEDEVQRVARRRR